MVGVDGSIPDPQDPASAIDDASAWGAPRKGRKSEKRKRTAVVSVRLSDAELSIIQERAHLVGESLGTYMRQAALNCNPGQVWGGVWGGILTRGMVTGLGDGVISERHTINYLYSPGRHTEALA